MGLIALVLANFAVEDRAVAQPPPADDWAAAVLANDPLAGDNDLTLEKLNAALADENRRESVIPLHFVRANLPDEQRRAFLELAFGSPSMKVRRQAAAELQLHGWLQEVVSELLWDVAARNDQESRFSAVLALRDVALDPDQLPPHYWNALVEALAADEAVVRDAAEEQCLGFGAACVPTLVDVVQHGEARLRLPAARMLSSVMRGPTAAPTQSMAPDPGPPVPGPSEEANPPKARPQQESEPKAVRDLDESHTSPVRVYFGTNREIVDVVPDQRPWLFGLPALFVVAVAFIVLRFRRRAADRPARSGFVTALVLLLGGGAAIWSAMTWNDALRTHYSKHSGTTFGPRHNSESKIYYGYCDVSLPPTHSIGEVEEPLIGPEDEDYHVVLKRTEQLSDEAFFQAVRKTLDGRPKDRRDCFVFVHGYNSTFEQAARRTAQIHYDLKFPGAPIFFSWPSRGSLRHYPADRNEIQYSSKYVKQFLLELTEKLDASRIHIIAHSMGADAVGKAIADLGEKGRVFDQIVLAAPDIDADVFREQIAPAMAEHSQRTTLYCSNTDWALVASNTFNDGRRAGDSSAGIMIVTGADTVDASGIDTALLGHSYYGDCLPLLNDVRMLLEENLPPQERELEAVKASDTTSYWVFRNLVADIKDAIGKKPTSP